MPTRCVGSSYSGGSGLAGGGKDGEATDDAVGIEAPGVGLGWCGRVRGCATVCKGDGFKPHAG